MEKRSLLNGNTWCPQGTLLTYMEVTEWWIWKVLILHLSLKARTKLYSIMVRVSKACLSHSMHRAQWHSPDFHCFLPWNLGSSWRHYPWGRGPSLWEDVPHHTRGQWRLLGPSQGRKGPLSWLPSITLWVVLSCLLARRLGTPQKALSSTRWARKESLQLFLLQYLSAVLQVVCLSPWVHHAHRPGNPRYMGV